MIKNRTKVDLKLNLRIYERILGKKYRIILFLASAALLLCGVVVIALARLYALGASIEFFFGLFLFVLGIVVGVAAVAFKSLFMKKILKKHMRGKVPTNDYSFTEEGYEVATCMNDGTQGSASGSYDAFIEAREYKDVWLLYLNKETVFAVSKSGMTEGTAEEISALLSRAMGVRYKKHCKK